MPLEDKLIVELLLLVLLFVATLVGELRRNKKLLADREQLLKEVKKLQVAATETEDLQQEFNRLVGCYARLLEDRRKGRQEMTVLESALEGALERSEDVVEQYGIPVKTHNAREDWIGPCGDLARMRVIPGTLDSLS